MPTGNGQIEVVFRLTDGTEITTIEDLTNVLTFLKEHQEYVKVVRCKECVAQKTCRFAQFLGNEGYCSQGERCGEVEE